MFNKPRVRSQPFNQYTLKEQLEVLCDGNDFRAAKRTSGKVAFQSFNAKRFKKAIELWDCITVTDLWSKMPALTSHPEAIKFGGEYTEDILGLEREYLNETPTEKEFVDINPDAILANSKESELNQETLYAMDRFRLPNQTMLKAISDTYPPEIRSNLTTEELMTIAILAQEIVHDEKTPGKLLRWNQVEKLAPNAYDVADIIEGSDARPRFRTENDKGRYGLLYQPRFLN
jgi:hypothetical protein